jgi:ribosomal protein L14E/L6E/L27E
MKEIGPASGVVVVSKAGRDAGHKFIILEVLDAQYVLIADGELRKVDKPKKKKIRHLGITSMIAQSVKESLETGKPVLNSDVSKALMMFEKADQKEEG